LLALVEEEEALDALLAADVALLDASLALVEAVFAD
jgi:hypothetical protein